jgi:hypothetical protein
MRKRDGLGGAKSTWTFSVRKMSTMPHILAAEAQSWGCSRTARPVKRRRPLDVIPRPTVDLRGSRTVLAR